MTTQINNYDERMLNMLLTQFKGKPSIEAVTEAFAQQVQEAENMWFSIFVGTRLEDAVGQQLDRIGNGIVDQPRLGLSDEDYLAAIKLKIQINISSGQNEILLSTLVAATGASSVVLQEISPATVKMTYTGGIFDPDLIQKLNAVKAAGVKIIVISAINDPVFTYNGAIDEGYNSGHYAGVQQNG